MVTPNTPFNLPPVGPQFAPPTPNIPVNPFAITPTGPMAPNPNVLPLPNAAPNPNALTPVAVLPNTVTSRGLMSFIANRRKKNSEKTVERMEHKLALYGYLGEKAITGSSSIEDPIGARKTGTLKPRALTTFERSYEKRLDRKIKKDTVRDIYRQRELNNSGATRDSTVGGRRSRTATAMRKHQVNKEYRRGNITNAERKLGVLKAQVKPDEKQIKNTRYQNKLNRRVNRSGRSLIDTAHQPVMQKWRAMRRSIAENRAVKWQDRSDAFATKHRERINDRRQNRAIRRQVRTGQQSRSANVNNTRIHI